MSPPVSKAIIADDEPALRNYLREHLQQMWPQLQICAEVDNGIEALQALEQHNADVIFLDIRMPGLDGMQVARAYEGNTRIVFVTAFDQYAVEAFEQHAVDYLLKPYTDERLQETIRRLHEIRETRPELAAVETILANKTRQPELPLRWIRVTRGEQVQLINVTDVLLFQSEDKYTSVYCRDAEYLIRTPLKELEQVLDKELFWRVHRSAIVNVARIEKAKRLVDGRYRLSLAGMDEVVMVSRGYGGLFRHM